MTLKLTVVVSLADSASFKMFFLPVPQAVWLSSIGVTIVLNLVVVFLLGHLLRFHIKLCE